MNNRQSHTIFSRSLLESKDAVISSRTKPTSPRASMMLSSSKVWKLGSVDNSPRNACATNSLKTGVRWFDGLWQHSQLVIVSDHQLLLIAHNHNPATGLHNATCEPCRNDVRLLFKLVEENPNRAELVQRRTCNFCTDQRDEDHVSRYMCRLCESVQWVLSPLKSTPIGVPSHET